MVEPYGGVGGSHAKPLKESHSYIYLLNSQPRILYFKLCDWFTESRLSANIPMFDLIWETSAASPAQL